MLWGTKPGLLGGSGGMAGGWHSWSETVRSQSLTHWVSEDLNALTCDALSARARERERQSLPQAPWAWRLRHDTVIHWDEVSSLLGLV